MTISGSQSLGSLVGSSQPATFEWHWAYALLPFGPWLIVLLLLLLKPNRSAKAGAVLLPAAVSTAMVFAIFALPDALRTWLPQVTSHLILGVAALMLISSRYAAFRTGVGEFFSALILLIGFGLAAVVVETWTFTPPGLQSMIMEFVIYVFDILLLLAGLVAAARLCRRRMSILRLTLSFGLGALILTALFSLPVIALQLAFVPNQVMTFMPLALGHLVTTPLVFMALLFPFVLLVAFNSLHRERLEHALRPLPLPLPEPATAEEDQTPAM